jgi:hypothetical protein
MLTQTGLVSKNSKCKWRARKELQKQRKGGEEVRAAREGSKGQGQTWPSIRPTDLVEGAWTARGGPQGAEGAQGPEFPRVKALKGRSSHA